MIGRKRVYTTDHYMIGMLDVPVRSTGKAAAFSAMSLSEALPGEQRAPAINAMAEEMSDIALYRPPEAVPLVF